MEKLPNVSKFRNKREEKVNLLLGIHVLENLHGVET